MRALRSFVVAVAASFVVHSIASAQPTCPATAVDCVSAPAAFDAVVGRDEPLGADTGWFPDGSPVQLRALIRIDGASRVALAADANASWPDPITLALVGQPEGGSFGFDYGFTIELRLRIGVRVLGRNIGGEWVIPIPNLPPDLSFSARRVLSDLVLEGDGSRPTTLSDTIAPITVVKYDALQSVVPVAGLSGSISLEAQGALESTYVTDRIEFASGDPVTTTGARTTLPAPGPEGYGAQLEARARAFGTLTQRFGAVLRPRLELSLFGVVDYGIDIASLPVPLPSRDREVAFPESVVDVPLPDLVIEEARVSFGSVLVGATATRKILVRNAGRRTLTIEIDPRSDEFLSSASARTIPPYSTAPMEFAFRPSVAGPATGTIVLLTNDPDRPEATLTLVGEGTDPAPMLGDGGVPDPGALGDGGLASTRGAAGCSCDVGGARPLGSPSAVLALCLVGVASARTRRRRVTRIEDDAARLRVSIDRLPRC